MKNRVHWDQKINSYTKELMQKKHVLFMGDLNVAHNEIDTHKPDPKHPSFTFEERQGLNNLINLGLKDYFRLKN